MLDQDEGKSTALSIHAFKGTEMYTSEFGNKYKLEAILRDDKENDAVDTIRANSKIGKSIIWPVARTVDIESAVEVKTKDNKRSSW